jgi:hypothetical protein
MSDSHQYLIQKSSLGKNELEKAPEPLSDSVPFVLRGEGSQQPDIEKDLVYENDKADGQHDQKCEFLYPRGSYVNRSRHKHLFPKVSKLVNRLTTKYGITTALTIMPITELI